MVILKKTVSMVGFALLVTAVTTAALADPVVPADMPAQGSPNVLPADVPPSAPISAPKRANLVARQLTPIEFGTFASEFAGGAVTITPQNARIPSGSVALVNSGSYGAAEYEIIGNPEEMVIIYLPDRVNLNRNAGGSESVITNLTIYPSETITLDGNGRARVRVGGTLRVSGGVSPGPYNGNFDLDVRYLR